MSEAKHTPGPWEAAPHHSQVWARSTGKGDYEAGTRIAVAMVGQWDNEPPQDESDANLRLIVAAPDLLAVLRLVESNLSTYRATGAFTPGHPSGWLMAQVADAIAKAKGA